MSATSAPSDVLEPFSYHPLKEAGEVRLLRINRREKGSNDPLQCILGQTTLDKGTKFSALSYCWDVHLKSNPIIVNGKVMHITESLATALDSLASSHHHVVVWADAICINQMDAVEKTQQVQMMGKIYSAAEKVVIWLGPSTTETRYTVRELSRLGDRLIGAGLWDLSQEDILNWSVKDADNSKSAVTKRKILDMATEHERQARNDEYPFWWIMSNLGKRKWFSRIWCIQELTNARTAIFRCGEDDVEFTRVWATALYFKLYVNRIRSDPDFDTKMFWKADWLANILSDAIPTAIIGIRRRYLTSGALDLKTLLNRVLVTDSSSNGIDASDPRDRVYALLGLANDAAAQDIIADYTLSCEDAYINTARALLRHGHDDVLSLCRVRNKNSYLPSWVPDWTAELRKPWSTWHTNTRLFHAGKGSGTFIASDDEKVGCQSKRHISLEGVIVDTIKDVGYAFEQGLNDSVDWTKLKDYFSDIACYLSNSNMYSEQQKEEAEWRIPVGDTEVSDATHQTKRASRDSDMKVGYAMAKAMANKSVPPEEIEKAFLPLACFHCQLERMYDSRPFISQSGYVGLGPLESQPGDTIIIFQGAQVPYILRQDLQNSAWTLIGESHVYGIMDGEFMLSNPATEHILLV